MAKRFDDFLIIKIEARTNTNSASERSLVIVAMTLALRSSDECCSPDLANSLWDRYGLCSHAALLRKSDDLMCATTTWPALNCRRTHFDLPVPQAWLEFDVDNVEEATGELESRGYRMLIKNKKEPWGQTVTRFISPEGLLVGVTVTPLMREKK